MIPLFLCQLSHKNPHSLGKIQRMRCFTPIFCKAVIIMNGLFQVAGWGSSELGMAGHGEPRMARIPIVSTAVCRASKPEFHKLTSDSTICAG